MLRLEVGGGWPEGTANWDFWNDQVALNVDDRWVTRVVNAETYIAAVLTTNDGMLIITRMLVRATAPDANRPTFASDVWAQRIEESHQIPPLPGSGVTSLGDLGGVDLYLARKADRHTLSFGLPAPE